MHTSPPTRSFLVGTWGSAPRGSPQAQRDGKGYYAGAIFTRKVVPLS